MPKLTVSIPDEDFFFFSNNLIPDPNTPNPNFKQVVLLSNTTKATLERKSAGCCSLLVLHHTERALFQLFAAGWSEDAQET